MALQSEVLMGPNHMYAEDEKLIFRCGWAKGFFPSNWKIKHEIKLKWSRDMVDWLEKNANGWWQFEGWQISGNGVAKFTRDEDAMAFKLRWL